MKQMYQEIHTLLLSICLNWLSTLSNISEISSLVSARGSGGPTAKLLIKSVLPSNLTGFGRDGMAMECLAN